jgi:ferredoxin
MNDLIVQAKALLEAGTVKVVIGVQLGTSGRKRPVLAKSTVEAARLVWDDACRQNLAVYLTKREVRKLGRAAIVAGPRTLRAMLQLAAERQLSDGEAVALAPQADGTTKELASFAAIEEHLATVPDEMPQADRDVIAKLTAMTAAERRAFWADELGRCIKCYACRSSCPMCYCERCTMDVNRPQWVPVASHALGNLEYHLVRAMHLAGRCVECGTCGEACPVGIPVHLLTMFAEESVRRQFGQKGGASAKLDYAMSTFRPDDKESFIR